MSILLPKCDDDMGPHLLSRLFKILSIFSLLSLSSSFLFSWLLLLHPSLLRSSRSSAPLQGRPLFPRHCTSLRTNQPPCPPCTLTGESYSLALLPSLLFSPSTSRLLHWLARSRSAPTFPHIPLTLPLLSSRPAPPTPLLSVQVLVNSSYCCLRGACNLW